MEQKTDPKLLLQNSEHFATRLMNSASAEVSGSFDSFSNWVATGSAAAIGLLMANVEDLTKFVPASAVGKAAGLLAWVLGLAVLQKIPSSLASSRLRAFDTGWSQGLEAGKAGIPLDLARVSSLAVEALPWPLSYFAQRRVKKGIMALPRSVIRLSLLQGVLVVGEIILVMCAVFSLASWLVV